MKEIVEKYSKELEEELKNILHYWMAYAIDKEHGGFYGRIDNDNNISPEAAKGSVLNSRILWSLSAAYNSTGNKQYMQVADRVFNYFINYFIDKKFGGVFWTVDSKGQPLDTKNQI